MTRVCSLETSALRLCKAVHIETSGRPSWPVAVHTVAYRMKVSEDQLHDSIYYAKMNGWVSTGGVPVHSLMLRTEGQVAALSLSGNRRIAWQ
jgi:hypothetical protein